jgi:hypothetical protein
MRPYSRSASRRASELFWGLNPRRFRRASEFDDASDRSLVPDRRVAPIAPKVNAGRARTGEH